MPWASPSGSAAWAWRPSRAEVDPAGLKDRVDGIVEPARPLDQRPAGEPAGSGCCRGSARFVGPHEVEVDDRRRHRGLPADAVLISTGSRPRIPAFCQPDGDRVLTTRDCYPPKVIPGTRSIIGSGVTGVEFVHMFASLGAGSPSSSPVSRCCRPRIPRWRRRWRSTS